MKNSSPWSYKNTHREASQNADSYTVQLFDQSSFKSKVLYELE